MILNDKFSLLPVEPETKKLFLEWWRDPEVRPMQDSSLLPVSRGKCEENFEHWFLSESDSQISFQIMTPDRQKAIGIANLRSIDWLNRSAEFTIFIGNKSYWNKGIGKGVTRAMTELAFKEYNLHRLMLRVYSHNQRAINVYKKIGFKEEGRLRHTLFRNGSWFDTMVMSILSTDYLEGF